MANGMVKLYDARVGPNPTLVFHGHNDWIVSVRFTEPSNGGELLTACASGLIRLTDARVPSREIFHVKAHKSVTTCMAVHPRVHVMATGTHNQFIQILSSDGEELSRITSYNGFAANRLGSISCLAFHPNELILAAGDSGSIVSIFAPDDD
ncbi:unnamed protein product [Ascophyllum nodosum]